MLFCRVFKHNTRKIAPFTGCATEIRATSIFSLRRVQAFTLRNGACRKYPERISPIPAPFSGPRDENPHCFHSFSTGLSTGNAVGTSLACPAFGTNAICRRQIRRAGANCRPYGGMRMGRLCAGCGRPMAAPTRICVWGTISRGAGGQWPPLRSLLPVACCLLPVAYFSTTASSPSRARSSSSMTDSGVQRAPRRTPVSAK